MLREGEAIVGLGFASMEKSKAFGVSMQWEELHIEYLKTHLHHTSELEDTTDCTCGAEPARPIYSTDARKPRLLSEVLASVVENEHASVEINDKPPVI